MANLQKKASLKHLQWLVTNRSKNQDLCLKIYEIIEKNRSKINSNDDLQNDTQGLVGIVFSLWRAVFLADIEEDFDLFASDYEDFLLKLVQHNAISYSTDRDARHWTYIYYINNARYRLNRLKQAGTLLPKDIDLYEMDLSPTEEWVAIHNIAELATSRLEEHLAKI